MNQMQGFVRAASLIWIGGQLAAQSFSITGAVRMAGEKYPAVRASLEQVSVAASQVNLARLSYLPRADILAQVNRATRNNVFGMLLPQPVIPSISGPVLGTNALTNVWGSAVGALVSWEPFDFGLRRANVGAAAAARTRAEAAVALTRFEVEAVTADAFLTLLAAEQSRRTGAAALERARVLERTVGALVKAELRPGADASRARAEVALAETQVAQSEQAVGVARAALAQLLGVPAASVQAQAGPLLSPPPEAAEPGSVTADHPAAREQNTAVEEAKARLKALERSYFPRFNLQASSYARGTGAQTDGSTGGALTGLGPNIQNWAVGMTVTFPVSELASLRERKKAETHRELAEKARYDQVVQDLNGRREKARAQLDGARRVARLVPLQGAAARAALEQSTARYQAGLATVVEVAEAQRLLAQAEIDDALAKLGVWRALLGVAAAAGDLEPFLQQAGR